MASANPPPDLYVANDLTPGVVLHFNGTTGAAAGTFAAGNATAGLAFGPDGSLYIAANADNDILRYDPTAGTTSVFVAAGAGGLQGPQGLTFGPDGNLYVENSGNSSVLAFSGASGASLGTFVTSGSGGLNIPGGLAFGGLAFGPDHSLYVASTSNSTILRYNGSTGAFLDTFVPYGSGGMIYPLSLTFGPDNNLYVASAAGNKVLSFSGTTGAFLNTFVANGSGGSGGISGLAFGPDGDLYASSNRVNTAGASGVMRFNGATGAFLNAFAYVGSSDNRLTYLAFGPTTAAAPQELITNGGFEVGGLAGWMTNDQSAEAGANSGSFIADAGTSVLDNAPPTVGPDAGSTYAVSSEVGPGAHILSQSFTVPGLAQSVTLSFDMFVDNYASGGVVIDPSGLDPTSGGTGNSNQHARVDLLRNGAPIFTTNADQAGGVGGPGVLRNFFDGADTGPDPHPYTHYTFDITPQAGVPATYTLRFANVTNRAPIHQGIDNVSVKYVPVPVVPSPLSLSVSPATVTAGGSSSLTVTLSAPAQPGPDPSGGSAGAYGAVIPLANYPTIINYPYGPTSNNGLLFHENGYTYVLIPTGQTTTSVPLVAPSVATSTPVIFTGTYGGKTASTTLTIKPVQIASLTLNPTSVVSGQAATATLTLNAPAVPMPDPNNPGQTAPGAVIQINSDSPLAFFPNVAHAANGNSYVFIPRGQTSTTFTIGTGNASANATANIGATLNGASQAAPLALTPVQVASLTLNPASVISGQQATATVTLNAPAIPMPDPNNPGQTASGAVVQVGSDNTTAASPLVIRSPNGNSYVFIPQGQTSVTFPVGTSYVAVGTAANISAALNGSTQSAPLTVIPLRVVSLTLSPTSVTSGGSSTATVTLNSPAVPSPDPNNPGHNAYGAFVQISSDSPVALFPGAIHDASGGTYALVFTGQTSATFTVGTGNAPANTTANVTAAFNGSSQAAPLTITPVQVASLSLNPTSVVAGGTSAGTVTLNAPALPMPDPNNPGQIAGGAVVQISSDSPLASFPDAGHGAGGYFVLIPQGQTSATFAVGTGYTSASATANISVSLNGASQAVPLAIAPLHVALLTVSPASVTSGGSSKATVTLNSPAISGPNPLAPGSAAPGVYVQVSSDNAAAFFPTAPTASGNAYVLVPLGQTGATFPVGTGAVAVSTTANIAAALNGSSQAAPLTVTPAVFSGVSVSPNPVIGGQAATGTVTCSGPVGADTSVTLTSNSAAASVPASVTIPAGQASATFPVSTRAAAADVDAAITAVSGGVTELTGLLVKADTVAGLTLSPATVAGGGAVTGTVSLAGPAAAATTVGLTSSNRAAAAPPSSVVVPAGATSAPFTFHTSPVTTGTTATLTATLNGGAQSATLTVLPGVKLLSVSPASVTGGTGATGRVTLNAPAASDTTIVLSSSDPAASAPATVTVAAGTTSAAFPITTSPVASPDKVTLTASFDGFSSSASLTVNPPTVSAVSVAPGTVAGGAGATGTVTLNAPAMSATLVTLTSNSPSAAPASPTVTVLAGASSATFPLTTAPVSTTTPVTLTASLGTTAKTTKLTVNAPMLAGVSVSPSTVPGGTGATGTVTLTGAAATAIVVTLTSSTASATFPSATVTVPVGASSATFPVTTAPVAKTTSATLTAASGSVKKTAALTITH